jgi:hypothetical protein
LGVLLVEIFSHFTTGMERAQVLGKLKNTGDVPSEVEWTTAHSTTKQARVLAKQLLATDPNDRPSCVDILKGLPSTNNTTDHNNNLHSSQRKMMAKLQDELRQKDNEIWRLQRLLDQNHISYR